MGTQFKKQMRWEAADTALSMSERIFITMEEPTASVNALRVTVIVMLVILYRSAIKGAFTSNYVAILYWAVIESHRTVLHHNTPCHIMPHHATSCHIMPFGTALHLQLCLFCARNVAGLSRNSSRL
jgi:hypothetical protein